MSLASSVPSGKRALRLRSTCRDARELIDAAALACGAVTRAGQPSTYQLARVLDLNEKHVARWRRTNRVTESVRVMLELLVLCAPLMERQRELQRSRRAS